MPSFRSLLVGCYLAMLTSSLPAQHSLPYYFRYISQEQGLLNNLVYSVAQDNQGFIWLTTPNGLQRYDGYRFRYYPEMLSDPEAGLTYYSEVYADKQQGLLWIVKNANIEKMELGYNRFSIYNKDALVLDPAFHFENYTDTRNGIWMLGTNALYHYDSISRENKAYLLNIFPHNARKASSISPDSLGQFTWITWLQELYLFDRNTHTVYNGHDYPLKHPLLQSNLYSLGKGMPRYVMTDHHQNIWVTTWGSIIYRYDPLSGIVHTYSLKDVQKREGVDLNSFSTPLVNAMLEDDHHIVWLATENAGLLRYDDQRDQFDYCVAGGMQNGQIRYNFNLYNLFQDRQQNIWVSTDMGISLFNPYRHYFSSLRHIENEPNSIRKSEIESFIQTTNGDIYIGTWGGGIGVYDKNLQFRKNLKFEGPPETNFVWCFVQPDAHSLWIGCQHGYLISYDPVTGHSTIMHPPELNGFTIRCMEKDSEGNIWLGLHNGDIIKWDRASGHFMPAVRNMPDKNDHPGFIYSMYIGKDDTAWISTELGFRQFDMRRRVFTHTWLPDSHVAGSLTGKTCEGIEALNDSTLLIGTIYGGLNIFDTRKHVFTPLITREGLPFNSVYAIKKDDQGYIWFTTDYGVYKFRMEDKKLIPYPLGSGVLNASFSAVKLYPLQNGQWLSFSPSEAVYFHPGELDAWNAEKPEVEITGCRIFDKPLLIDSLLYQRSALHLNYTDNFITLEFAALDFSGLQQTRYTYRLSGVDHDWVQSGSRHFANYTGLKPGDYTFEVRADNGNGEGATRRFEIVIDPPFWGTQWFRIAMVLLVCGLVYAVVHWRLQVIRKNEATKRQFGNQMAELEMKALRSQMNPHFIFNCINSIDALIQSNDKYQATVYLNKFAKLLRNILDSSRQNLVPFSHDMETLQLYIDLELFRSDNKFVAQLQIDEALMQDDYKVPPLVIQPYVENAILHGLLKKKYGVGKLQIQVRKKDDRLLYIIEDNGIGRQVSAPYPPREIQSYGLQLSSERIRLFNKETESAVSITDLKENGQACGTRVEVYLKIQ